MRNVLTAVALLAVLVCMCPLVVLVIPVWAAVFLACDLYDRLWPPRR